MLSLIAAGIITFGGSLTVVEHVWPYAEPHWYASHEWVRDYSKDDHVLLVGDHLQFNNQRRDYLLNELQTRELELSKGDIANTPQYRDLTQKRVNTIKQEIDKIDKDNKELLEREKAKR